MTLSFPTKEHHLAALYDACLLIVNTYNETKMWDGLIVHTDVEVGEYEFMMFAKEVLNQIAEGQLK